MDKQSAASNQHSADNVETLTESGFYWRERGGVKVLVCRSLEDAGFVNGFSTRLGGVTQFGSVSPLATDGDLGCDLNLAGFDEDSADNIHENRRRFLRIFDGKYNLATAWQVHGDGVKSVRTDEDVARSEEKFDGLISDLRNTLLGVKTADCVPVLIGDPKTGAFSAVHAGWRGTAQSIVTKAVAKMREEFGSDPANLLAAIGPAAGCKNYEVGQNVIDEFAANFSTSGKYFTPTRVGHALIDLQLANIDQMIATGLDSSNIYAAPFCTMEHTDLFFSYRVEKKLYGRTGRMMSVIGRKSNESLPSA
ncbi:MAG: peptidoglycan editing factor PgeF [Blastocatellia bacterium]